MGGKWRASGALVVLAALPVSTAIANTAVVKPTPGTVFVGAPAGFRSDQMHLRVYAGNTMRLVGSFAWSYGCSVVRNYGAADAQTIRHTVGNLVALFPAPTVLIRGNAFAGSTEFAGDGHRYGRFTISGTFTSARAATATFTFANPPHCGTFTEHFTLRAA